MSSGTASRAAVVLAIAFASACIGSYSRAIDETRAGLLGLEGGALRECLGVPTDFTVDGDLEQQTYRFDGDDMFDEPSPRPPGEWRAVVTSGRAPSDSAHEPGGFPRDEPDRSFCQLDFELTRGRVTRVLVEGRTREGMDADGSCLLRAQPCLAYGDDGAARDLE